MALRAGLVTIECHRGRAVPSSAAMADWRSLLTGPVGADLEPLALGPVELAGDLTLRCGGAVLATAYA